MKEESAKCVNRRTGHVKILGKTGTARVKGPTEATQGHY